MYENGKYSMLIDINGDGLPDRVFDRNPKTVIKAIACIKIDKQPWLVVNLWIAVKHSIR
jgi:hypothetical protein